MGMYSAIIIIDILVLCITAADAMTNRLLDKPVKNKVLVLCIVMGLSALGEYVGYMTNGTPAAFIPLHKFAKAVEFSCAPMLGVIAATAYGNLQKPKIPIAVFLMHAAFECAAVPFHLVFSVDAQNMYHRQGLYFIYVIAFIVSVAFIFICIARTGKEYQTGVDGVLIMTMILISTGIVIQFIYRDITIDFLCIIIANYLIYTRYYRMILQVDALTHLLNRRCYENNIGNIGSRAVILNFDVNKFKQVNDVYGHHVGDICLKNVADTLRSVYGRYGSCYRIGGDEFCVILNSQLDDVDELNKNFADAIAKLRQEDTRMPNVALGYAYYDAAASHVQQAIEEADSMMYKNKKQMS